MSPAKSSSPGVHQSPAARIAHSLLGRFWQFRLVGPLCMLLLVCGFCWKLTLSSGYTWADDPDIVHMDVPRLQFQRVTWHNHEFPLWDPHLWCGQPFLGEIVGAAFPLNWPFFRLPRHATGLFTLDALNWYFVMLHLVGALAAFWLCRELELSLAASLLGGMVYSFGGFVGRTLWPEVLSSLVLAPFVLLFLVRALRGRREWSNAAFSGLFLGFAWLSGHHEIPIYLSFTVAAVWAYGILQRGRECKKVVGLAGVSFVVTALTSAFQTIPGYEYARLAVRWVGLDYPVGWDAKIPYRIHEQYSLLPSSLVNLLVPWITPQAEIFTGLVAVVLAVIAVIVLWHDRWVRLFACIGLGGLLLALGAWDPIHGLLYAILPLFEKARTPVRLLALFQLGVAVLAAAGLNAVQRSTSLPVMRKAARILFALGGGIFVIGTALPELRQPTLPEFAYLAGLIALLFAGVLAARFRGAISFRAVGVAAVVLVCIELSSYSARLFYDRTPGQRTTFLPDLTRYHDIADFLRSQPGPSRVYAMDVTDSFNLGDWEGIDTLTGYGAGVTSNMMALDWASLRGQNLLGVGYSLSRNAAPRPDQTLVFHGSSGLNVFKNADAFPRAWVVHRIETVASAKDLPGRMNDPAFDARHTALLAGSGPAVDLCGGTDDARISRRTANTVVVEARLSCRGMIILSDTWYPGWTARVDGKTVPIYQADVALRGVVADAGPHRLEFRYRPLSAILGGLLSALGILCAGGIWLWERRRA